MNIVALQDKPLFQNATEIIIFDGLRIFTIQSVIRITFPNPPFEGPGK
jgi:hypothetical protein